MSDPKRKSQKSKILPDGSLAKRPMRNNNKRKWTDKEEEVIEFFMGLIPVLLEAKSDLETKNLLGPEFYDSGDEKYDTL